MPAGRTSPFITIRSLYAAEPTIPSVQLGSLGMRICRVQPHWLQYFKI